MTSARTTIVLACATLLLGACSGVKSYEREMLSDPIMSFSRDPVSDQYLDHVYDVREGARGATTTQGGGCGCN
jgi:hypothetical protein